MSWRHQDKSTPGVAATVTQQLDERARRTVATCGMQVRAELIPGEYQSKASTVHETAHKEQAISQVEYRIHELQQPTCPGCAQTISAGSRSLRSGITATNVPEKLETAPRERNRQTASNVDGDLAPIQLSSHKRLNSSGRKMTAIPPIWKSVLVGIRSVSLLPATCVLAPHYTIQGAQTLRSIPERASNEVQIRAHGKSGSKATIIDDSHYFPDEKSHQLRIP